MSADRTADLREWAILISVVAIAIGISYRMRLTPKWEHAFVYTVIVFAGVLSVVRPARRRTSFWAGLLAILFFHALVLYLVTDALPLESRGIRGIPLIIGGMAEGVLIAGILWRVSYGRR